jgi:hypothetical protein
MIQIKRWDTLEVIIEVDVATIKEALEYGMKQGTSFYRADLSYADLSSADLCYANLCSANLSYANLCYANLCSANLSYADLSSADLRSANLRYANLRYANLSSADLSSADLSYADLSSADLSYADLSSADLCSADLRSANLRYADLSSADLSSANLSYAKGIIPQFVSPLHMLLEQPAAIRAYKLVKPDGTGPYNGGVIYRVGEDIEVKDADTNPNESCAAGINVATLDWCLREWQEGYRILVVEFVKEDIACIPTATDGKFRLRKCKVVREVDLRAELNWPPIMEEK